jgi:hypothetical protein
MKTNFWALGVVAIGSLVLMAIVSDRSYQKPTNIVSQAKKADIIETSGLNLTVLSPVSGTTVNSPNIKVTGKTAPKAEVFINDLELLADNSGNFFANLTLEEDENSIFISANDENGNFAEKEIVVNLRSTGE